MDFIGVLFMLYIAPAEDFLFVFVVCLMGGPGLSVCFIMPWAMLPDVCDLDEAESGDRKEGVREPLSHNFA